MAINTPNIYLENQKEFANKILEAIKEIGDLRTPFKLIANDFYKSEESIFLLKSSGAYSDFKNKKSRDEKLRAVGFDYPLLKRSGNLMRSVLSPKNSNSILEISKTEMFIGTKVLSKKGAPYPIFLQKGTRKMQARPFLFIGPESTYALNEQQGRPFRWTKTLQAYVEKKINFARKK